jgi:hypothetical protein
MNIKNKRASLDEALKDTLRKGIDLVEGQQSYTDCKLKSGIVS